jgi:hypothetical protein
MKFGEVDINPDVGWSNWSWPDFLRFYDSTLKGHIKETAEEVAKELGVKQITIKVKE